MDSISPISLLINGLTLSLSLSFLLVILGQDWRKELNQFFAIFLLMVAIWNVGAMLTAVVVLTDLEMTFANLALSLLELGFTGSSIAVYVLTAVLLGIHTQRFRWLALASLGLILVYRLFLIATAGSISQFENPQQLLGYRFPPLSIAFYLLYDTITFYQVWRFRRKLKSRLLVFGLLMFVIGQMAGFLNPELPVVWISTNISSIATLILSYTILRLEVMLPLAERVSQVEAMHRVSLAISSQIAIDKVLEQIVRQAAAWLNADAAGIFLKSDDQLELATVHNMPYQFLHSRLALGVGVAGTVAQTQQSIRLDNYERDWRGEADLPGAKEFFGALICVPLTARGSVIGALMVVAGRQGRLFAREDVHLLELLSAQAAVAIDHSQLFQQVESARGQLASVLVSTENPVLAVSRDLHLIFINPAAKALFNIHTKDWDKRITEILPREALPTNVRAVIRELRQSRVHIYEISLQGKVYLCHLARIGSPRPSGWVAVLNDVTQLKELDRIKSEMVRMASHDLKNPLFAAMANLDLLKDELFEAPKEDIQSYVEKIDKQFERMNRIIRGILDLERLKTGKMIFEVCQPKRLVERITEEMRPLAQENLLTLETNIADDVPEFMGDAEQFERALINLVENAIKFTPANGTIHLRTYGDPGGSVRFEVRDTGIGVPADLHERIFERFFRGQQKGAEHITGSGLGLSLVKTIVENHHGTIWLTSPAEGGTTFYISIPAIEAKTDKVRAVSTKLRL
jgi:signal transduction histidine kinase